MGPVVQTIVLLASIISVCLLFYIVYKSCRLRKDFGNASKVFSLTSEALRDCNVAIVHANCCIASKQVPENNTTGTTASDVDLEEQVDNGKKDDGKNDDGEKDDGENEVVKPKEYNIRPILTF